MPSNNGFRPDNDKDVFPGWPYPTEQDPKCSILNSQSWTRAFSFEHAQLLTKGEDLQAQAITGTEEGVKKLQITDENGNHGLGFISYAPILALLLTA
jgi:hypothetical protein